MDKYALALFTKIITLLLLLKVRLKYRYVFIPANALQTVNDVVNLSYYE